MSTIEENASTIVIAAPSDMNVTISGIVIAATEPSTMISTAIATSTPIASVADCSGCSATLMAWPPRLTCRPSSAALLAVLTTRSMSVLSRSLACLSNATVAKAIVPSWLIWPGPA